MSGACVRACGVRPTDPVTSDVGSFVVMTLTRENNNERSDTNVVIGDVVIEM